MENHQKPTLIHNITVYAEDKVIKNGFIKIVDGKIVDYGKKGEISSFDDYRVLSTTEGSIIIPGFIDLHIHGANGSDTMDGTMDAIENIALTLPREGTTSFLATTITQSTTNIEKSLMNVGKFISAQAYSRQPQAEVIGVHLEGPFIHHQMAGAQPKRYIQIPKYHLFNKWQDLANSTIKQVTLAPEIEGGIELIRNLRSKGVIPSIGHSKATYEEVMEAINAGTTQVTHLFNQMSSLHHREPGVVGAALLHNQLFAEIIVDGVHVSKEIIQLAYQIKTSKRLILITDSIRAKYLKEGYYDLGGQSVTVKNGLAELENGTLAGSILKMIDAVNNMISFTGCSIEEVIEMTAKNPAQQLDIYDRKGSIAIGKDADLVILNNKNDLIYTICKGQIAYKNPSYTND
ncbi:N-acetylglucosamine-6-phosphate deacetylase [Metabacillus malikii]|nr:N-acetylglucosamine-6-phosphate deacetylase [Metabacillus malikii]